MKETLNFLFSGNTLDRDQAKETLMSIGQGNHTEVETAAFLTVFNMRKITPMEMAGFRDAMVDLCLSIDLSDYNTIDVCGTGGDGKNTFNVSTLSAFVIAGAGAKVAKHGNYGLSSPCGSSNIFEYFGYKLSNNEQKLKKEIEEANICYFHAPLFHPAMKYVAPVRKALKVKTFFNMLGPLMNPSKPNNQLAGVFDLDAFNLYADVFKKIGTNFVVVHSLDGYDEISLTGDFKYVTKGGENTVSTEFIKMGKVKPEEIFGGNTIEESAKIFMDILENRATKAKTEVAIANSAFALHCFYSQGVSIEDCVAMAKESLESGKALNAFNTLMKLNGN